MAVCGMESSPLTQQARPETFQPKIVELYEALFRDDNDDEKSEGFWREFFVLRPDRVTLQRILTNLSADELLHLHNESRQLFAQSIQRIKSGTAPSDEIALDTLTVFLHAVLTKRYTNPSSDIIAVLAGLDQVDHVFTDFVNTLDNIIRNGRTMQLREKAIDVALSITSGAYQTSLISYFIHRDLFPSLMKYTQDRDTQSGAFEPFLLLGLLANYNKFEFQNPYRLRLEDFVNENAILKIVRSVGTTCSSARDEYVAIQNDLPEGWTLNNTLSFFGLGALTGTPKPVQQAPSPEAARAQLAALPIPQAAILLGTYDFANANSLFCHNLVSAPAQKHEEAPFASFLSFTSYLLHHAHRSTRTTLYSHINLLTLRIIIEDPVLCKRICSDESKSYVRLCRQRQPYLPLIPGERIQATVILDIVVDSINHNLRRRLDVALYLACIGILLRMVSFLSRSRVRLSYHWSELWRSLLNLMRFLTSYADDFKTLPDFQILLDSLVNVLAFSISAGEAFLPDAASYDDLFYKLVESGDTVTRFQTAHDLSKRAATNSIETLIGVTKHYHTLLESEKAKGRGKDFSPREVTKMIRQGYDTLSFQTRDGLDSWNKYREAEHRLVLKQAARTAVSDVRSLLVNKF
ncbi:DUF1741-domain-containing protein [Xylona heveae TC161]|uniref:DUF1741-domain-containing protein n=1 Tax=Xylona heveae (strain CBS 132557 / TC161) TaxID=1328760 RepID=A0A165A473_XYLHT|nr:DUF1741-domain-containing protein [Xylona heveae TC161]KZF19928.1 DUF1741-domain-containing protein [Xylona heveae TC161]